MNWASLQDFQLERLDKLQRRENMHFFPCIKYKILKAAQCSQKKQKQKHHISKVLNGHGQTITMAKTKTTEVGIDKDRWNKERFWKQNFQDLVSLTHTQTQVVKGADMLFLLRCYSIYKYIVSSIAVILIPVFSSVLCILLRTEAVSFIFTYSTTPMCMSFT